MSQELRNIASSIENEKEKGGNTKERVAGGFYQVDKDLSSLDFKIDQNKANLEDQIADATSNNKGIFTTLAKLQTAYPSIENKKGWYAFVDYTNPREKYIVTEDRGAWTATGELHNVMDIDLGSYLRKEDVKNTTGISTTQVMSQDATSKAVERRALTHREDGSTVAYLTPEGYLPNGVVPLASEQLDGLMSKEDKKQLNEIEDGMKTAAEKYDLCVTFDMGGVATETTNIEAFRLFSDATQNKYDVLLECEAYSHGFTTDNASKNSYLGRAIDLNTIPSIRFYRLYANGITKTRFSSGVAFKGAIISSKSGKFDTLEATGFKGEYLNVSNVRSLSQFQADRLPSCKILSLSTVYGLKSFLASNCPELTHIRLYGDEIVKLVIASNIKLNTLYIGGSLRVAEEIDISSTAISVRLLSEQIEAKWVSRVGLKAGILTLSQSLHNEMSTELKKKFIDKNITLDVKE